MRSSVMFLMLAAASSIIVVLANDQQPSFDEFLAKKGKVLVGAERSKRAQAYSASVQRINQLNAVSSKNPHAARYKVNEFSLLTLDEFRNQKTGLKLDKSPTARRMQRGKTTTTRTTTTRTTTTRTTTTKTTTTRTTTTRTTTTKSTRSTTTRTTTTTTTTSTTTRGNSGASFDWSSSGYMQPIKNQGSCGSCWAFAAVALVETYYAKKTNSLVSLSEQQLVDCETTSYGCNGGFPDDALLYEKNNGAQSEVSYPYAAKDQACAYNSNAVVTRIGGFNGTQSEADMFNILQNFGPILICLDADDIMSYSGGVVLSANCRSDSINHAVVLVGYGTDGNLDYWKVRNSWDTWWGEDGYFRLERNKNTCGIVKYPAYYITS